MKEKVNELRGVVEGGINEISAMNKRLSEISGVIEMMKSGVNEESIEAIPCMCDIVLGKVYRILNNESIKLAGKFSTISSYIDVFDMELAKPKYPRRPRTPKAKEEVKPADKPARKTKAKKDEPVEDKVEPVIKIDGKVVENKEPKKQ